MLARDIMAEQDKEYQESLLQDELQDELKKMHEKEYQESLLHDGTKKIEEQIDLPNELEDKRKENEYQLSPSSLRLARLRYFEKPPEIKRCDCFTKKGVRCSNRADVRKGMPGNICFIHYKSLKKT